jgi:hypothetical protein
MVHIPIIEGCSIAHIKEEEEKSQVLIVTRQPSETISEQLGDVKTPHIMEQGQSDDVMVSVQPDEDFKPDRLHQSFSFDDEDYFAGNRLAPHHFEPMQVLGKGSFGEVYLVRKKSSGIFYAMKVQSKDKIISNNLVKYA